MTSLEAAIPEHLAAMQMLVNRCRTPDDRKGLIVMCAVHGAIDRQDAELLIQANQLETA